MSAHDSDYMWICGAARCDLPFTAQDGADMDATAGIANRAKRRHATGACARGARMTLREDLMIDGQPERALARVSRRSPKAQGCDAAEVKSVVLFLIVALAYSLLLGPIPTQPGAPSL